MKLEFTFAWSRGKNLPENIEYNREYDTQTTLNGKKVFIMITAQGDIKSSTQIAREADIVSNVDTFLGVEWGCIRRSTTGQIHNINAITNAPDQHASIIFQNGNKIGYWYNETMTLSTFMRMPFIAMIVYTKN